MVLFIILTVLYFIPSIIAFNNKKLNRMAVLMLNIFLGWTFIGWVVALVWALTKDVHIAGHVVEQPQGMSKDFKLTMKWILIGVGGMIALGLLMGFVRG
ncbi:MAG: superinfection immunity protein [Candidatus Paceibacterota bacterium]